MLPILQLNLQDDGDARLNATKSAKRLHPEAGVTLVEMMVVILIIGLITAIVAINVLPARTRRGGEAKADIATRPGPDTVPSRSRAPPTDGVLALVTPAIALGAERAAHPHAPRGTGPINTSPQPLRPH
jgi:prepilin-type N-terminal cleavage/methylation domain-containing protein